MMCTPILSLLEWGRQGGGDGQESDVLCITFVTATANIWRLAHVCPWAPWKALYQLNALLHTQSILQGNESDPNLRMFVSSSLFICKILIKRLWNQIEAYTRKRVLFFFGAEARWVFWWRQMVEGREGWLKNQIQHIHPLAVEQDTPGTPRGCPLRLIYASTPPPSLLFIKIPLFHRVISSSSSFSPALAFCYILHFHWQKQQEPQGKYAKLLSDLPLCSGRSCAVQERKKKLPTARLSFK